MRKGENKPMEENYDWKGSNYHEQQRDRERNNCHERQRITPSQAFRQRYHRP